MLIHVKNNHNSYIFKSAPLEIPPPPPEINNKKRFFKKSYWRLNRKTKILITTLIIATVLFSSFAFLSKGGHSDPILPLSSSNSTSISTIQPTITPQPAAQQPQSWPQIGIDYPPAYEPNPVGLIEGTQNMTGYVWNAVAANAWGYFQPGVGVDSNTGLPGAISSSFPYFTDWDLGVYIQSILDAYKVGLIGSGGDWGADARLNKALTFLENRELNTTTGYPYWFYQMSDGKDYHKLSDVATGVDIEDTGRLMVALNNIIAYNSSWATRIDNFVYNTYSNRSNYAALVPQLPSGSTSNSIYAYYCISGFACFWPNSLSSVPQLILSNIFSSKNVTIDETSVSLPEAAISPDPLLCSVFELNNNDSRLTTLANLVYLAHEEYYNNTGQYIAFSEGNGPNGFIYEWVVLPNGDSWRITASGDSTYSKYLNIDPVVYNKITYGFLALHQTTFAINMAIFLEQNLPDPTNGYSDGASNSGNLISGVGSNTNGMILDAAAYALRNR